MKNKQAAYLDAGEAFDRHFNALVGLNKKLQKLQAEINHEVAHMVMMRQAQARMFKGEYAITKAKTCQKQP